MQSDKFEIGKRYPSKINTIAKGCTYEVIQKNKTTCWVQLWEYRTKTETIYKGVPYSALKP